MSLDAPTVAVVWTIFVARLSCTALPATTPVAMGLVVWMLYAGDRLLDTRGLRFEGQAIEPRHRFHNRHRRLFGLALATAALAIAGLLPVLPAVAIRLYLAEGALMAGYFLLIHVGPEAEGRAWIPKELIVGPFFAGAIFIPVVSRRPELRDSLVPLAVLFGGICCLNCLYIYRWEHTRLNRASWPTSVAVQRIGWVTVVTIAGATAQGLAAGPGRRWFAIACGLSSVGLAALDRMRPRLSTTTLRALADGVLLTPLIAMACGRL